MRAVVTRSRQLVRQFIDEALYDPVGGYFIRSANIFSLDKPLEFNMLMDIDDYQTKLFKLYREKSLDEAFYQLWHTPSELFQPHYANAIANYILTSYTSIKPLVIYEVGPGTGTLCEGITRYLDNNKFDYEYNLIEISERLYQAQRNRFSDNQQVLPRLRSFFGWQQVEERECVVIAMEVWDNLAQDLIQFSQSGNILQGVVETNEKARYYDVPGKYSVQFEPANDSLIIDTYNHMDTAGFIWKSLRWSPRDYLEYLGYESQHKWQYIPTGIMAFLNILQEKFPKGHLVVSDFDMLPDTTPGLNAPVVQTRYKGDTVNCSTILLKKGLFDIFFPTDFSLIQKIIQKKFGIVPTIVKHSRFLQKYADCSKTVAKTGYNPMLEEFENVSFLLS